MGMVRTRLNRYQALVLIVFGAFLIVSDDALSSTYPRSTDPMVPSYHNGAKTGDPSGTLTSCGDVRKVAEGGKRISGGQAGLDAGGDVCFDGVFCATMISHTFLCAGVTILQEDGLDINWSAFDASEDKEEEEQIVYYNETTTRDATRGRASYVMPLFMNEHGVCRRIDNTEKKELPVFMGVRTAEEWRTVHGVPEGADPMINNGYQIYADGKGGEGPINVGMEVCCAPVMMEICGERKSTGYATVNTRVSMWGGNGGHATVYCAANNNWMVEGVSGICGEGGGGGGGEESDERSGVYNPMSGGEISAKEWRDLSPSVKETLKDQGYRDIKDNNPRPGEKHVHAAPEHVEQRNRQAQAEIKAAEEKAKAEAEAQKLANEAELKKKQEEAEAERKRREEEEKEEEDDDDN